jgi:hypothetical protein
MQYRLLNKRRKSFFVILCISLFTFLSINMPTPSTIAKPCSPYLGSYDTPGSAQGISAVGPTAYVADGPRGLQVIQIPDCDEL